jgi:RimJ/RimL family protein N-acetyltransferase
VGLLRVVDDADLDVLFEHWTDAESNRMAAFTVANPHDRQAFADRWARLRSDPSVTARTIDVDGTVGGSISSWDNGGTREVTYWLGREHWGKGIATAALARFLELVPERPVFGRCAADNTGSLRVLEKNGFVVEAEERGFANARGSEIDELLLRLA